MTEKEATILAAAMIASGLVQTPHFMVKDGGVRNHQELVAVSIDLANRIAAAMSMPAPDPELTP